MTDIDITYTCDENAIQNLIQYCQEHQYTHFNLIHDQNTQRVLGNKVVANLTTQNWHVNDILLEGEEIVANEKYLQQVLDRSEGHQGVFIAVGSGTINDICRYCSHFRHVPFLVLPTAPSVDGFASIGAPIVVKGFKKTVITQPPVAIFADLPTLCASPRPMIAAGFGDMLGKYTSLADWQLDHLLWDQAYNAEIAGRMYHALQICVDRVNEIRQCSPEGISGLMNGLVESGICMVLNGNSRPAAGAEHHLSHYWEMKLLQEGRPALLHGAKVGIGTVLISQRWEKIGGLDQEQIRQCLSNIKQLEIENEIKSIQIAFGEIAEQVVTEQQRFLSLSSGGFKRLQARIVSRWDKVLQIAQQVPSSMQIVDLLKQVHAPSTVEEIGLSHQEQVNALRYAPYLRNMFTVSKLGKMLGLWE
jgi:glycerol-1-phosphate dehydrogenase [NAD(P)+]